MQWQNKGKNSKLKDSWFRLDIAKKFFIVRLERNWNALPREVVAAPSLVCSQFEWGSEKPALVEGVLIMVGGLELDGL